MIHYSESEYKDKIKLEVDRLLGQRIPIKVQLRIGSTGSNLYRILDTKINENTISWKDLNVRANFEKFPNGLLLRINYNQDLSFIALTYSEIESIEIEKGEELINPFPFGLFYWLLKLGVQIRYARYFARMSRYRIERMKLTIRGKNDLINLDANGYNYYSELKYFEKINKNKTSA